jgi:hypothetical protein
MTRILPLGLSVFLIIMAASDFTALPGADAERTFHFNYFTLSHTSGWGRTYVSEYSLSAVAAYLLGDGIGLLTFVSLFRSGFRRVAAVGAGLSLLGILSFGLEGSHWLLDHHHSAIVNLPDVYLLLCLVASVQVWRSEQQPVTAADPSITNCETASPE